METFSLDDKNHIELCKLLKKMDICFSKIEAEDLIRSGLVKVNDIVELRRHTKLSFGDQVEVYDRQIQIE